MAVTLMTDAQRYVGLSSDAKPDGRPGAEFYETDTGRTYVYNGTWSIKP